MLEGNSKVPPRTSSVPGSDEAFQALLLRIAAEANDRSDAASLIHLFCHATREFFQVSGVYFWRRESEDQLVGEEADGKMAERFQGLQNIEIAVARRGGLELREIPHDLVLDLLAPEPVHGRVGQDALENERQLGCRSVAILLGEPDHRVLDDVQRGVVVANGVEGALEGPLFDALEEVGEFFFGSQERGAAGVVPEKAGAIISSRPLLDI